MQGEGDPESTQSGRQNLEYEFSRYLVMIPPETPPMRIRIQYTIDFWAINGSPLFHSGNEREQEVNNFWPMHPHRLQEGQLYNAFVAIAPRIASTHEAVMIVSHDTLSVEACMKPVPSPK